MVSEAVVVTESDWVASQLRTRRLEWLLALGGLLVGVIVCLFAMMIAEHYAPGPGRWPVAASLMLLLLLPLAVASQPTTHRQQGRTDQVVGVLTEQLSRSATGCGVDSPDHYPAARRAQVQRFANSDDAAVNLGTLARLAGARIGLLRVMAETQLLAATDSLTGLSNRRSFEQQVAKARRVPMLLTLAVADLDHFKQLNDTYGHETGDRALRLFAQVLTGSVRLQDLVCRHGGEEFVLALNGCDAEAARDILDSRRGRLDAAITVAGLPRFTASFGVVQARDDEDLPVLINRADAALFQAKRDGRDRVVIHDSRGRPVMSRSDRADQRIETDGADRC